MPDRSFYSDSIASFRERGDDEIVGILTRGSPFSVETNQRDAWLEQIGILRAVFSSPPQAAEWDEGNLYFEYNVPRMGKRIDVVALIRHVLFVIEFKVGAPTFASGAFDQVYDYALDLKNFHESSHDQFIAPLLVATRAGPQPISPQFTSHNDRLLRPIPLSVPQVRTAMEQVLAFCNGPRIAATAWEQGRYCPTPTIVEAAMRLYGEHSVADISRSDAGATNLTHTSESVLQIIQNSRLKSRKSICFVTGVPGAGKTLVGLNVATQHRNKSDHHYSVFLSGNGPLVRILCEALAKDKVARLKERGEVARLGETRSEVKAFIQNVHHFRDDCLRSQGPPVEHVALFDEAQRAWNQQQTAAFMQRKRGISGFSTSEPEFLIACMDRHKDWTVIVCLVGGGQEINTGEAGIGEWISSLGRSFGHWDIHISPRLLDSEYGAGKVLEELKDRPLVYWNEDLHLSVSMRSFRAENVSAFVKAALDLEKSEAQRLLDSINAKYPIVLTRDLARAKGWLRQQARGSERYGLVVSSQALRLKPHAIDVRSPTDPVHWFLDPKEDVRSSYYLEDAATEFDVQGLELDWAGVVWDGDFRWTGQGAGWAHHSFVGDRWNRINRPERQTYLKNAYRVLLTRARQGMVIVVPESDPTDPTRSADIYDPTFQYLRSLGIRQLGA